MILNLRRRRNLTPASNLTKGLVSSAAQANDSLYLQVNPSSRFCRILDNLFEKKSKNQFL